MAKTPGHPTASNKLQFFLEFVTTRLWELSVICAFQKALAKVPCVKLLQKFKTCSLTGKILYRFYNWLYGRQKCVVFNGTVSG